MLYAPISVIIPCYKCSTTITRAVQSVLKQSILPTEIILIDDCSPDNGQTLAQLDELQKKYTEKVHIIVLQLADNQGPASARNAGWEAASQSYIAFLDADDAWHSEKIKIQSQWMAEHPDAVLTGHTYQQIADGEEQTINSHPKIHKVAQISPQTLLYNNYFYTRTVMVKRDIPQRFTDNKRYSEDYLLWLQVAYHAGNVYRLDCSLAFVFKSDYGDEGLSAQLWPMEKGELETYEILAKQEQLGGLFLRYLKIRSLLKYVNRVLQVYSHKILK